MLVNYTTAPTYTVSYNGNGATSGSTPSSQTKTYGVSLTLQTNSGSLVKAGYTFAGWNTQADGNGTGYTAGGTYTANAAVTLYAKWTAITYTVSYNGNGNTGGATSSSSHTYGTSKVLTANGFTKTGYTFAGWATSSGGSVVYSDGQSVLNLTSTSDATVTLYAKWTAITYTVLYNGNGNTGGSTSSSSYTYGTSKALTANGFTKTGYTFAGWATSSGGSVVYSDGASVLNLTSIAGATVTLYAKWTAVSTYTVSYNVNGATSGSAPASQSKTYDIHLTLQTNSGILSRTGYTFMGWNTQANGAGVDYAAGGTYAANASVTLYAKWAAITYTVSYNGNGNTGGSTASSSHTYDAAKALTANGFIKTGYTFAGWATSSGGSAVYSDGQSVVNLASTQSTTFTLYAQWTQNASTTYTVTYKNYNGSTLSTVTVNSGATFGSISSKPTPTRTGYTWNTAWYKTSGTTSPWSSSDTITGNVEAWASGWTSDSGSSTFSENWESGQIDTAKWKIWGDPVPTIVTGGNSIGNFALTSNGDANYESGVTSLQSFIVRPGLTISAKVFVQAPGTDVWSKRSWHCLELTSRSPEAWNDNCGAGDAPIGPCITLRGNTPTDTGLSITAPVNSQNFDSAPYLDKWISVAFTFNEDGSVTYFIDGNVLYTTSSGWIDYDTVSIAYLVCGGRSEGSTVVNLHDDILVSYAESSYTVTFKNYDGSALTNVTVSSGATFGSISSKPTPTRTGYTWDTAWYKTSGTTLPWSSGDTITENVEAWAAGWTSSGDVRHLIVDPILAGMNATVNVPVKIDMADSIRTFEFSFTYPTSLVEFVSISAGSLTIGWMIDKDASVAGKIRVGGIGSASISGSGTLVTICLHTKTAQGTDTMAITAVSLNGGSVVGEGSRNVSFSTERFMWGDVNNDGVTGLMDASDILRWKLGKIASFPISVAADVDGNGTVGLMDASDILRLRLGKIQHFIVDIDGDGYGPD